MKRRDLFTAAAGAITGCAVARSEVRWDSAELDHLYGRLDRGLASVGNPFQEIVPRARFHRSERAFVESTLRSLLLTGAYRELPATQRQDPRMTSRLEAHRSDFDLGLRGSRALLEMSPAERVTVQRAIRRNPTLASQVTDALGQHARLREVGGAERLELWRIAQQCAWRVQHQPLSLIAEDTLDRMRRVEAQLGAVATKRRERVARSYDARTKPKEVATATTSTASETPEPDDVRGKRWVTTGLWTMGGGLALGSVGVALAFTSFDAVGPSIAVCGVGGVLLILGLVFLIYGAVVRANAPDDEVQQ